MNKKLIVPGCFRTLEESESRFVAVRHGGHVKNVVKPEEIEKAMKFGAACKAAGLDIHSAVCSPSPRAQRTGLAVMEGYGKMFYQPTDIRLADLGLDYPTVMENALAVFKGMGIEGPTDFQFAELFLDAENPTKKYFYEAACEMANEAAKAIFDHVKDGETTLVTSHGVGRIEPAIMLMEGKRISVPAEDELLATCGAIEVILNIAGQAVEVNWLECPEA